MDSCSTQRSSGAGVESGESEDESTDDSSSNYAHLCQFRDEWRQELQSSVSNRESAERVDDKRTTEKAKRLFMQGTDAEEKGSFYEAVKFYRQAVQLVPDIEFKVADDVGNEHNRNQNSSNTNSEVFNDDLEEVECVDLLSRFQKIIGEEESLCQAEYEQKMTHVSILPMEILIYIFKWVVSSELDMRSLEQLSMVCRGFYICAKDSELWRLACCRVWGIHTGTPGKYSSWRNMFITRTRLRYNGAYISKTTYIRHGENSFQDQFYQPWHLVEYFRYLRFFPDGVILMLTTPDDPPAALTKLSQRSPRHSAVLVGQYCLHSRSVMAVLKRPSSNDSTSLYQRYFKRHRHHCNEDDGEQTFHIELQVKDYKKKSNYKLVWTHYAIHTIYKNGSESTSDFDLIQSKFPPFWFSRVKSYTAESMSPLH